jgi:FAD/FMN-containing dehydrogenase
MSNLLRDLREALSGVTVIAGEDVDQRYWSDWYRGHPTRPLALVRARSTDDVSAVMSFCNRHRLPVIVQGGLTGLCGGAEAEADAVILNLERMSGVEAIDLDAGTMTVLAGTPLETAQKAAEAKNLLLPLDLGARGSCTIGGNIATNAGGNNVIRYGMTRAMVLGLEAVLPDGTVLSNMNSLVKNNAGYDLKHLFIGSEGTLGVVTRAVLQLQPRPLFRAAALLATASFDALVGTLTAVRRGLPGSVDAFEVMWPEFYGIVTSEMPKERLPIAQVHPFYALVQVSGNDEAHLAASFDEILFACSERELVTDAVLAKSEREIEAFWAMRDAVAEFQRLVGPRTGFDVGLPLRKMEAFVEHARVGLASRFPGAITAFYGHLGDGNLHLMCHVPNVTTQPKKEIEDIVYSIVRDLRGSISAEHGIGKARTAYLNYSRTESEIALMQTLKRAIDPNNILNPGRVIAV